MPGSPTLSSSPPYARRTFACDVAAKAVSGSSASNDCSDKLRLFILRAYQSAFVIAELLEERTKISVIETTPQSSTMCLQNSYPGCRWRSVVQQRPAPGRTWRRPGPTDRHNRQEHQNVFQTHRDCRAWRDRPNRGAQAC